MADYKFSLPLGRKQALQAQLAQLAAENAELSTRLEVVTAQAIALPPGPQGWFSVNPPEEFDGDSDALPSFLTQCNVYMEL